MVVYGIDFDEIVNRLEIPGTFDVEVNETHVIVQIQFFVGDENVTIYTYTIVIRPNASVVYIFTSDRKFVVERSFKELVSFFKRDMRLRKEGRTHLYLVK